MFYFSEFKFKKIVLILFLYGSFHSVIAQNEIVKDSIPILIKREKNDTIKLLAIYNVFGRELYLDSKFDSALLIWDNAYSNLSSTFSQQSDTNFIIHKGSLLNNLGVVNQQKGNLSAALYFQYESLKLREKK